MKGKIEGGKGGSVKRGEVMRANILRVKKGGKEQKKKEIDYQQQQQLPSVGCL